MSIVRRLLERRDLFSSAFVDPNRIPLNSECGGSLSPVSVSADTATRLSAVFSAVRLVSQTVAGLPVGVFRKVGDRRLELPLPSWLERPNPDFNRFEFVEQVMTSLLLWGNAYLFKILDGDRIDEMWIGHPSHVKVEGKPGQRTYKLYGNGQVETWSADEVVHIRGTSRPGSVYGMSPIDEARQSFGLAMAAEEFGARFFANGTLTSGVVEFPGDVSDPKLKQMAQSWKRSHQGIARAHEPGFLTGGAKWTPISIPNDSAQFIETRKMQVSEIARWFGVPAHKIGDLEHATFSNIEHQAIEFVTDGILPWLVRLESALNPLLGPGLFPDRRTRAFLKFNVDGLLRGDSASRGEFYNTMRNIGAINADEIRALEDLPPLPNGLGKVYWQPMNVVPAGTPPEPKQPPPTVNGNGAGTTDDERVARLLRAAGG